MTLTDNTQASRTATPAEMLFARLTALGVWPSATLITAISIALSILITALLFHLLGIADPIYWHCAVVTATVAPLVIAGSISTVLMRLFLSLTHLHELAHELATTDTLTGLPNRRHFRERAQSELLKSIRYGVSLSVAILDVDHFKQINDRCGHGFGDTVLRSVADACSAGIRDVDTVARYGGEEFAILFPHTDLAGAAEVAERIRWLVADMKIFDTAGVPMAVTASIGVAALRSDSDSFTDLMRIADEAMYRAKDKGRNRVEICSN